MGPIKEMANEKVAFVFHMMGLGTGLVGGHGKWGPAKHVGIPEN